jgi:hypothetical protein
VSLGWHGFGTFDSRISGGFLFPLSADAKDEQQVFVCHLTTDFTPSVHDGNDLGPYPSEHLKNVFLEIIGSFKTRQEV